MTASEEFGRASHNRKLANRARTAVFAFMVIVISDNRRILTGAAHSPLQSGILASVGTQADATSLVTTG